MSDFSDKKLSIGILQTDWLVEKLANNYPEYPEMFQTLFYQVTSNIEFSIFDVTKNQFPKSFDDCDAYLITGSKKSVYETIDWIDTLAQWLIDADKVNKKLVGICFGHQLLAQTFGGETAKASNGWGVGLNAYNVLSRKIWMNRGETEAQDDLLIESPDTVFLLASHQDQVLKLPEAAELLMSSEFCPNAAFTIGDNILGIQGHPEFSVDYSESLMLHRKAVIPNKVLSTGLASIGRTERLVNDDEQLSNVKPDSDLLARWILNFFTDN